MKPLNKIEGPLECERREKERRIVAGFSQDLPSNLSFILSNPTLISAERVDEKNRVTVFFFFKKSTWVMHVASTVTSAFANDKSHIRHFFKKTL